MPIDPHEHVPYFEGKPVTKFEAILPRVTTDAPETYRAAILLRLASELRVADVKFKDNGDGTYTRQHFLAWESVQVISSFDPADTVTDGGSASSTAVQNHEDLGLKTGRSGDVWPGNVSPINRAAGE